MEKMMELLRNTGKCCITGDPLVDSEHINMVPTIWKVKWLFPRAGNVIEGTDGIAMAVVHDKAIDIGKWAIKGEIKFVIEFNNGEIIYHSVEGLQKMQQPNLN